MMSSIRLDDIMSAFSLKYYSKINKVNKNIILLLVKYSFIIMIKAIPYSQSCCDSAVAKSLSYDNCINKK